ncbi:MAG TPA: hypothetical protein VMO81_01815 [Aestuariivirgaceae bacterium]|nr:hypothetical protein [Aestuariivirgaceae bacterium]
MLSRSEKDSRRSPSCSCLLEAYRNFPAETVVAMGCASPDCPVRALDGVTLHQFLEAIGSPEGAGEVAASTEAGEMPIFRTVARRRKRRKSRREPD